MTGFEKTRPLAGTVMVYIALFVSPGTSASVRVCVSLCSLDCVCALQLCFHIDLLNFCNSVSGGYCLVAGGTLWVTEVSICLLPHFLFRPTGTEGREWSGGEGVRKEREKGLQGGGGGG